MPADPIPKTEHMLEHQLAQKSGLLLASERLARDLRSSAWKRSKDAFLVILLGMIGLVGLCLLVHASSKPSYSDYQSLNPSGSSVELLADS